MKRMQALLTATLLSAASFAFADTPATDSAPAPKAADPTSLSGTAKFGGGPSTWTATLKPTKTPGVYDADYIATYQNNRRMTYAGQITTDWKTEIKLTGKATGGGGNGNFEITAKIDDPNGKASSTYKEVGGRGRSGPFVVDLSTKK